jgi:nitroreductase
METWRAISTYRAVRAFDPLPLPQAGLERILRAGRRAPSSKNTQRWAFVACTERAHLRELSEVGPFAGHIAQAAAAVALVVPDAADVSTGEWTMFDLGQAAQNMLLAAWDQGVGAVHAAVYDQELAKRLLGYPDGYRCDVILAFGYPADPSALTMPPGRGGRRSLDELVHWERW